MNQPYKMASAPAVWASSRVTGVQKHMEKTEVLETHYSCLYKRLDSYDHCQSINTQALTGWTDQLCSWTKSQTCSECELIVVRPERTEPWSVSVLGRTYNGKMSLFPHFYYYMLSFTYNATYFLQCFKTATNLEISCHLFALSKSIYTRAC